jgi:hypothetical protein
MDRDTRTIVAALLLLSFSFAVPAPLPAKESSRNVLMTVPGNWQKSMTDESGTVLYTIRWQENSEPVAFVISASARPLSFYNAPQATDTDSFMRVELEGLGKAPFRVAKSGFDKINGIRTGWLYVLNGKKDAMMQYFSVRDGNIYVFTFRRSPYDPAKTLQYYKDTCDQLMAGIHYQAQ